MSVTLVYYTANSEAPDFESKIVANIKQHSSHLPVISVSQRPMDFGTNINVGPVGCTNLNGFRQMLVGAEAATTPYVLFAEADFLYPKEYFEFVPPGPGMYYYTNVWLVYRIRRYGRGAFKKKMSEGARICDRETFVTTYRKWLAQWPTWSPVRIEKAPGDPFNFEETPGRFDGPPALSWKTGRGLRGVSTAIKDKRYTNVMHLPPWGDIPTLRTHMFSKDTYAEHYAAVDAAREQHLREQGKL